MKQHDNLAKSILLEEIDFKNRCFKISKNHIDDRFIKSIKNFGILEPPVLIKDEVKYTVLFGFNRLDALNKLGKKSINAVIIDRIDSELYIEYALLKCIRNEIGPAGKIKLISILTDHCSIEDKRLIALGERGFNIPEEFILSHSRIKAVNSLPEIIKDYIDLKDINFRLIKDLLKLPGEVISQIAVWIEYTGMRVNIFKRVLENLIDIYRRDNNLNQIKNIEFKLIEDRKERERCIYKHLFKIRYPEYSCLKQKANTIVEFYLERGILIDLPEYFEGDSINIIFRVKKGDDFKSFRKKLDYIDEEKIDDLLGML